MFTKVLLSLLFCGLLEINALCDLCCEMHFSEPTLELSVIAPGI